MFCGTYNTPHSIHGCSPHLYPGILRGILSVPDDIVMDLIDVMNEICCDEKLKLF